VRMCNLRLSLDKQTVVGSVSVVFFSLADGALTIWGMDRGVIEEANPVMQLLIIKSPIGFMAVKLALPVILGLIFWRIRNKTRKLVTYGLVIVLGVYAVVTGFHVYWIIVG